MKQQTKQNIKKIISLIGLGLLFIFAVGSIAFLGYELATQNKTPKQTTATLILNNEKRANTSDLTGTTWVFNNSISNSNDFYEADINFTSNEQNFDSLDAVLLDDDGVLYYENNANNTSVVAYNYGWTSEVYKTIIITGGADVDSTNLTEWLYTNATLQSGGDTPDTPDEPTPDPTPTNTYDFTFNDSPNMNAPFAFNVESIILPKPSNQSSVPFYIDYDMPYFTSNGKRFNQIRVFYNIGQNIGYLDKAGNYVMNTTANTCMATNLIYKDTATDSAVSVYVRVQTSMQVDNGAVYPWTSSWKWKSNNYRYLTFDEMLTTSQLDNLTNLNTGYETIFMNATSDIGLGGAFTILGSAFTAWSNIFAIQIIPGITIGLLLFLPLIVGIIVLVIWIVKR